MWGWWCWRWYCCSGQLGPGSAPPLRSRVRSPGGESDEDDSSLFRFRRTSISSISLAIIPRRVHDSSVVYSQAKSRNVQKDMWVDKKRTKILTTQDRHALWKDQLCALPLWCSSASSDGTPQRNSNFLGISKFLLEVVPPNRNRSSNRH